MEMQKSKPSSVQLKCRTTKSSFYIHDFLKRKPRSDTAIAIRKSRINIEKTHKRQRLCVEIFLKMANKMRNSKERKLLLSLIIQLY